MIAFNNDKEHLILENMGLVKHIASRLKESSMKIGWDDALSVGNVALCQAAQTFNPLFGNFSTYACLFITRAIRRQAAAKFPHLGEVDITIHDDYEPRDDREAPLSVLDEQERHIIQRRFLQKASRREVGRELGVSEKTVTCRTNRAIEKMRKAAVSL